MTATLATNYYITNPDGYIINQQENATMLRTKMSGFLYHKYFFMLVTHILFISILFQHKSEVYGKTS